MSAAARFDVHVLSTAHDVSDARLRRICEALVARGLSVLVDGVGDRPDHGPRDAGVRVRPRPGKALRLKHALTLPFGAKSPCLVVVDPDAVPAALAWRRMGRGRRVIVDVHEDYSALLRDRTWAHGALGAGARVAAAALGRATSCADLVVVADDHLLPDAPQRMVVRNLPRLTDFTPAPLDDLPRAVYVGDVRASRGLVEMVDGVLAAPPWTLDIIGPTTAADVQWVKTQAATAGRPDAVRLHGRLPSSASWDVTRGAWAGMALLHDTPAFRAAMPTKVYEYAASGLATIASPLPRVRALLESSGGGVVAEATVSVAALLTDWTADPERPRELGRRGRAWAERELGAQAPFDLLAAQIEGLLSRAATEPVVR